MGAGVLVPVLEEPPQPVRRGGRPAGDDRDEPAAPPVLEPAEERREGALLAVGRLDLAAQPGRVHEREADRLGGPQSGFAGRRRSGGEPHPVARHARPLRDGGEGLGRREEMCARRQGELRAPDRRVVLPGELGVEVVERLLHRGRVVDVDRGAPREVGEERDEAALVEAGEERLHPEERGPLVHRVEDLAHPRGGAVDALRRVADRGLGGFRTPPG